MGMAIKRNMWRKIEPLSVPGTKEAEVFMFDEGVPWAVNVTIFKD